MYRFHMNIFAVDCVLFLKKNCFVYTLFHINESKCSDQFSFTFHLGIMGNKFQLM